MFRWGKSSKGPAPAGGGGGGAVAAGEVAVQKVEKIDFINIVKPPIRGVAGSNPRKPLAANGGGDAGGSGTGIAARKPDIPDINWRAGIFIENTRKRWSLGHKSFRDTVR